MRLGTDLDLWQSIFCYFQFVWWVCAVYWSSCQNPQIMEEQVNKLLSNASWVDELKTFAKESWDIRSCNSFKTHSARFLTCQMQHLNQPGGSIVIDRFIHSFFSCFLRNIMVLLFTEIAKRDNPMNCKILISSSFWQIFTSSKDQNVLKVCL